MPSKSQPQRRAMEAAAAGRSTLGIPKSVGEKFRVADRRQARAMKKRKRPLLSLSKTTKRRKR